MKSFWSVVLVQAAVMLSAGAAQAQASLTAKQLAATPPMGWNSWNWFAGKVTDKDVRQAADLLVSSGMRDAGYIYVNIDDTWEGKRDASGVLHTNEKFPDMKALADYVHGKGLKLGIYSSPGPQTCAHYEGSYQHEQQDADLYASWGIDYLKYDLCGYRDIMRRDAPNDMTKQFAMMKEAYEVMHQALLKTGRPIVYSLCQYGWDAVWQWGPTVAGNAWRTTGDIDPSFDRMALIGRGQAGLEKYAGPGHWNDPDMLEVGNGKLTPTENRLHMSLWAMLDAPLLSGNNLSQMTPDTIAVLTNRDAIALDQDPLGRQASRVYAEGPLEIWAKPLADGGTAIAIFNFGSEVLSLRGLGAQLPSHVIMPENAKLLMKSEASRDVWTGKQYGSFQAAISDPLPEHAVRLLRTRGR